MTHHNPPEHFQGKSVAEHLKAARMKGAQATSEMHGAELPGSISSCSDSAKDTAVAYLILFAITTALHLEQSTLLLLFPAFGFGYTIWKTSRSALLGWGRLERLHRLIEEERWEIEHHRDQEKEELREMYEAKGFSGKLLDQVVEVLMADDNRLLQIMLEEELGLALEVYEHPLKQAFGAGFGTLISASLTSLAFYFWPVVGIPLVATLIIFISAHITAKLEKRNKISSVIWNGAAALFAFAGTYFLAKLL